MKEPLAYRLMFLTKKHLIAFAKEISELSIDRYLYVFVSIDNHDEKHSKKVLANLLQTGKSYMLSELSHRTLQNVNESKKQYFNEVPHARQSNLSDIVLLNHALF